MSALQTHTPAPAKTPIWEEKCHSDVYKVSFICMAKIYCAVVWIDFYMYRIDEGTVFDVSILF